MFSMDDFQQAKAGIGGIERTILFSISKNPVSYSMSLLNSKDRGKQIEMMIANRLMSHGFQVKYVGDKMGYDLLVNDFMKIEVKCATMRHLDNRYVIQKIKPECFDIMFMVFIAPDRQEIKWTTQEMVIEWANGKSRMEQGYNVWFTPEITNDNFIYNDNYHSFLREYGWQNEAACA